MHTDAIGLVDLPQRTRQADDRVLVGRVDRVERRGHEAGHRCGDHDRAAATRLDGRADGGNSVDDPVEVDGHRTPVRLRVEIVTHAAPRRDARIEVRDMEPTEGLDRECDRGAVRRRIGDVGPDEPAAEIVGHGLSPGNVDVGNDDMGASAGQVPGDPLTDAVTPAGDEGDLALDIQCHGVDRRGMPSAQPRREEGSGKVWMMLRCWIGRVIAT